LIIESTHTRVLGLEVSFVNLQEKYVPVTTKSKAVKERLNTYLQRLDKVSEENNSQQSQLMDKLETLEIKITHATRSFNIVRAFSIAAFVIFWPWIAQSGWKIAKVFIGRLTFLLKN